MMMQKSTVFWLADFCMCWLALCGLANAAVGLVSFAVQVNFDLLGHPATSPVLKVAWIAIYSAISAIGFAYMLWRFQWRCRAFTLLEIAVFFCVVLAALAIHVAVAIVCIGFPVLVYTVIWANRRYKAAENGSKEQ
jgi:hypothetical protein